MTERHFVPLDSPFEVELSGMRLIEAGAGTGKTWTLAALMLRLLLETKQEVGRILVVTFTRAASGELRGRIRARLVEALAAFEAGIAPEEPYLRALIERQDAVEARARLRLAIESFDEAAIFTINGFCQRALGETALAAGQAFERELLPDQGELLAAVARDAWRRELAKASPRWAQWVIDHVKGPAGLAGGVAAHLGRVDASIDAPAEADWRVSEQDFDIAVARVRKLWHEGAVEIQAWLAGANLKRNIYPAAKIDTAFATTAHWLNGDEQNLPLPDGMVLLSREKILQGRSKTSPEPGHPLFEAIDDLMAAAARLASAFEQATRRWMRDFLLAARSELADRKRQGGLQTYDDQLIDLAQALDGTMGPKLVADLRMRYRVALVDEFQDTNPLQLRIFTRLFGQPQSDGEAQCPLIFVGDPKQAIYGFRGADVFAYLKARSQADTGYALLENRRSDPPLIEAVNALFNRPRPFLLDGMPFSPARAATMDRTLCVIDDDLAPLTLWTLQSPPEAKSFTKEAAQNSLSEAVAADIARLLRLGENGQAHLGSRALVGGDIAVLVRKRREGESVRQALARHGIPSVSIGGGSVWHSEEAEEIERLLLAVAAPSREGLVRAALSTVLLGADAVQLAAWRDDEAVWSERLDRFHGDLHWLRGHGFMAMWRRLLRRENVVARILARPDGERRLTNYRHLAELLQAAEQGAALDAEGLARHIARQRALQEEEESQLRLESDAQLVRIVTLHAAKGLQYPVVYCPFLCFGSKERKDDWPVLAHREGQACLDFGSARIDDLRALAESEAAAEELRLAYVALTRAEHRCVIAWGKVNQSERSPLAWLLFGPRETVDDDPRAALAHGLAARDEAALVAALHEMAAGLAGRMRVLPLPTDGVASPVPMATGGERAPRRFTGRVPAAWRVLSFSALAAQLAEEAESADRDAVVVRDAVLPALTVDSIHTFPRGTRAGTCLHALFERIDFQGRTPVGPTVASVLAEYGYAADWQPVLERLVVDVLAAPLDASGLRLADILRAERLVELEFAFPLGSAAAQAGYMKGFIDLVFRHAGRWYIVDWKSNWLGTQAADYAPDILEAAMRQHRYDVQLGIYAAALKRALALREPEVDWENSFGGVFYLFLRGMGPDGSSGIHFSRPTTAEIEAYLEGAIA